MSTRLSPETGDHLPNAPQLGWSATFLRVDQHLHTLLSSDLQWEFSVKRSAWSGALAESPYLAQLEIVLNQRAQSQYQKPSELILSTSGALSSGCMFIAGWRTRPTQFASEFGPALGGVKPDFDQRGSVGLEHLAADGS